MTNLNQSNTRYLSFSFVGFLILLGYFGIGSKSSDIQKGSNAIRTVNVKDSEMSAPLPQYKVNGMSSGIFKAKKGLYAIFENFDFDAKCRIMGYEVTKVSKHKDAISLTNRGAKYSTDVRRLVQSAKSGDVYYYDKIKAKCPGDTAGRQLSSLVFRIK